MKKSPVALFLRKGPLAAAHRPERRPYYLASENVKLDKKNRKRLERAQKQERQTRDRLRRGKRVRRRALQTLRPSAFRDAPEDWNSANDFDATRTRTGKRKSLLRRLLTSQRHRSRRQKRYRKAATWNRDQFHGDQGLKNRTAKNNAVMAPVTVDELAKDVEKTINTASYIQKKRSSLNPVTRLRARILEHYMMRKRDAVVALVKAPIELVVGRNEQVSSAVQFAVDAAQAPIWWYFGGGRRGLTNLRHGRIFGRGDAYLFDCPILNNRFGVELRGSDEYADNWLNRKGGRYRGKKRHRGRRRTLGAVKAVVKHTSRGIGGKIFKPKKVEPRHKLAVFAEW